MTADWDNGHPARCRRSGQGQSIGKAWSKCGGSVLGIPHFFRRALVCSKLGTPNRSEAVAIAMRRHLI